MIFIMIETAESTGEEIVERQETRSGMKKEEDR